MKTRPLAATILVVDDEPKACFVLRNLIEPEGYRVIEAHNGPEALSAAAQHQPDVILLDVMMPGMDGFEVCRRLRTDPVLDALPILMLTALDDRESRLKGLEAGADEFINKPFDSHELRTRLRTITRLNRFRQLYEQRARFESVVAHSPDGIVLTRTDGTVVLSNVAYRNLFTAGAPVAENFFNLLPENTIAQLAQAYTKECSTPLESAILHERNAHTIIEITWAALPGVARLVQFNLRDLTDKKQLELQLLRSQRLELLGQLAGGIVHDANNVFAAIMASASLMEISSPGKPSHHLKIIQQSAERGASLLRQLLMFARGADGEFEPVALAFIISEIATMISETFDRNYTVAVDVDPDIPVIQADPTQLHQIIMNLCVNARDAMTQGGHIAISARAVTLAASDIPAHEPEAKPGRYVIIAVSDNGPGIPPEIRRRLFEPFFTTKPTGKGTGLGLATVLRLVKRHGGFVTLETEVGQGSSFRCMLPVS